MVSIEATDWHSAVIVADRLPLRSRSVSKTFEVIASGHKRRNWSPFLTFNGSARIPDVAQIVGWAVVRL